MRIVPIVLTTVLLAGCAAVLDGTMYSLHEALVLPMPIEVSLGTGGISAFNPRTGERFQGTYVGIRDSEVASVLGTTYLPHGKFLPTVATGVRHSNQVSAMATMIGDKGTVLDCRMLIQAGWRPRGMGTCTDNKGGRYNLQF